MNKHTEQLMQYPSQILQSRVDTLKAEWVRERESLPTKLLAFLAAFLSLISLGGIYGFNSLAFVLPAFLIAGFVGVAVIGVWGLSVNLRDSTAALDQAPS
ncbi:hypothetical protein [Pseudomonas sp. UMAB-40]|uniref:hypothetical protein n=1 Tax=Pseudomonas sp. UMAB-40 TaxID=1365407 RepID=UPI001C5821CB|nr:hypothetical protein [Pseudomonas sp. UMAB-40]